MDIPNEATLQAERILALENELRAIRLEKELAEEKLTREIRLQNEARVNSTLTCKQDWLTLANELSMLKGETIGDKTPLENGKLDVEQAEILCLDFANHLRIGALKELNLDSDEILIVKAKAYEIYYRAILHTLENRNLRLKIARRDEFEETKKKIKEHKNEKQREVVERVAKRTPEEIMIDQFMKLGMTREGAIKQIELMNAVAKTVKK